MLPYPNVGFAEDAPFFLKFREIFGSEKVLLYKAPMVCILVCVPILPQLQDNEGLCVHVMHRANTAQVLGSRTVSAQDARSRSQSHGVRRTLPLFVLLTCGHSK